MIGMFDSGSGGLTVLKAVREVLPTADVMYFGDIKNAPYGSRSREELSRLTINALTILQEQGATSVISACNSVSASLTISLFDFISFAPNQLIEMVGPTAAHFRNSDARILLCATPATIRSGLYQDAFHMLGKEITTIAIPDLAGVIEFGEPLAVVRQTVQKYFAGIALKEFDVLVLACTHYPLALSVFSELVAGTGVALFDPAVAVAERAGKTYQGVEVGEGKTRFLISQESETFRTRVSELFPPTAYTVEVLP